MLRVDHLKTAPLPPVSFEVANGHCLVIGGPSGVGKTRLLRAIADLDPAEGDIFLDGAHRDEMPAPAWRSLVRFVSAEPGWWTDTPRPVFAKTNADPARIRRALDAVGLTADVLDEAIAELSTGQRQRLALLRAIEDEPRVLLLDEPTAALDPTAAALVEELIKYQLLAGRIVLLVSHNQKLTARLGDRRLEFDGVANQRGHHLHAAPQAFNQPASVLGS